MKEINPIEVYECRILVFMEIEPQSNKYNQVLLSPEKFKVMSDAISKKIPKGNRELRPGIELTEVIISDEEYTLPDLQSIDQDEKSL